MPSNARFLDTNRITTASMITASSTRNGVTLNATKRGTGSAAMSTGGDFSGANDIKYTVVIDSVSIGSEIGSATFEWFKDGVSQAGGVATAITDTTLDNGVTVKFTAGAGNDFALNDRWDFFSLNSFGPAKIIDRDRDTRFRSADSSLTGAATVTITLDFGSAATVNTVLLMDHNIGASATITLAMNATDSWGSPSFSTTLTHAVGPITKYFASQSYRYARIKVDDSTNADTYLELSELFVGVYTELSKTVRAEFELPQELIVQRTETEGGVVRRRYRNKRRKFSGELEYITAADVTTILALVASLVDKDSQTIKPFWFNLDSGDTAKTWLVELNELPLSVPIGEIGGTLYYNMPLSLSEIIQSV